MPLQNGRGDVICGGGGSQGSVNGTLYPFASEGRGCFIDDDTILVQLAAGHVLARWRFRETDTPVVIEPRRGANAMFGGAGKWLADGPNYVYGSIPDTPGAASIGAAPDGTLAYYPNAQSGIGLVIVNPDGEVIEHLDKIAKPAPQVIGPGVVIWERGAVGRAPLRPARTDAQGWQLVTVDGEDWIVYWSEPLGLVAQRDGATDGYLLGRDTWHYHARNINGQLRVVWSVTDGEGPNDYRIRVVDRTAPRVPLVGDPPPPPPPPPPPTPPETKTMEMPANIYAVLRDVATKFKSMHQGSDDDRREATKRGIETVHAKIPGSERWQHKAAGPGNPPSKDAAAYIPDGPIEDRKQVRMFMFDLINGATREMNGAPLNGEEGTQWIVKVGAQDWLGGTGPVDPPPAGDTHRYIGGGNDTGTCDECGQPRTAAVHRVPEGKIQGHAPWLGEDGKGDCDLCFKAVNDPIHREILTPPPPPPPPPPPTPPEEPPVPSTYHPFVGSATAKFCEECGQGRTAAVHQKPAEPPTGGTFDDARIVGKLDELLASSQQIEKLIAEQTKSFNAGIKEVSGALGKLNLGGIFKK